MLAAIVAIGIAAGILFVVIGAALVTWGVLGALIVFGGIALLIAWMSDRRRQAQYDEPLGQQLAELSEGLRADQHPGNSRDAGRPASAIRFFR